MNYESLYTNDGSFQRQPSKEDKLKNESKLILHAKKRQAKPKCMQHFNKVFISRV